MASNYDLIAACWTSAGNAVPVTADERSPLPIRRRVEAVARAGFTGFGIRHCDLPAIKNGIGYPALRSMLADNGINIVELEYMEDWFTEGERRKVADQRRGELLEAAEALGARHIKTAGDFHNNEFRPERLAPHLEKLAHDAASAGTLIGLEPTPYFDMRSPQDAVRLVEMVDHPSAGVFVDIWHVARSNIQFASLAKLPIERIFGVELDDALNLCVGSLVDDTINNRKLPGEGEFDLAGFISILKGLGYTGPWGVEIIASDYRLLPVEEATRKAYDATIRFLE